MKNLEDKLQNECILNFSQKHPDMKGQLFAVNNTANSKKQAMHLKSLGVLPGVSDLIFIRPSGIIVAIEIKVPGSRHNLEHVKRQARWGKLIMNLGGESYFCTSLIQFECIIENVTEDVLTGDEVLYMCNKSKLKTIKF